jgi:two-component system response regulator HydG
MNNDASPIQLVNVRTSSSAAPRILIVEDDLEVSRAIAQMVRHLGYESSECNHAEAVLSHIASQAVDLMLVDYRLPELTGLDLILMLRDQRWIGPVIMMTGYAQTESRICVEKLNEFTMLRKPIAVPELAKAIQEALKGAREMQISQ